jgi:hypothetical protein
MHTGLLIKVNLQLIFPSFNETRAITKQMYMNMYTLTCLFPAVSNFELNSVQLRLPWFKRRSKLNIQW